MTTQEKIAAAKKRIKELEKLIDLWFNPSNPQKLVVFKKPDLTAKQENIMQIANYKQQLAELETQFWFHNLPTKEYIVRFDAIKKRINELEQLDD